MHAPPRTRPGTGSIATLVTLAVHGLFAVLLLREGGPSRPATSTLRTLEGTWIHLLPLPEPAPPEPAEEPRFANPPRRPADVRPSQTPASTAITLAPAPAPPLTPGIGTDETGSEPRPWTDWQLEAEKLSARREREMLEDKSFSGSLQALREPCKPYQSSMFPEKKPPEDPPRSWQDGTRPPPGSVMAGGTRVGVVPIFGAPIGGPREEPNKHLFDDMMAGRTPRSSVPDPNTCD